MGIRGWLRSSDLRFWRPQLYRLSYAHVPACKQYGPCVIAMLAWE